MMNNSPTISDITPLSFWQHIWRDSANRKFLFWAVGLTIGQFIVFKLLYPFPDFISDSYSYIFAASANLDLSIWPIGYSKFLYIFHFLTHSDTALIAFQYLFLELSALYFFFTILHFYRPARATSIILFLFLFFNPLFLYLSNFVNSDPVFAALSLFWFGQLLWIIHRPRIRQVVIQAVLLFLCFTVRNNAYYYPIIAAIAFILSRQKLWVKLAGMLMPFLFLAPFIIHTRNVAYKMTGTRQFSLFTGWQLANNALYAYQDMTIDSTELPSAQSRELDQLTKQFYRSTKPGFHNYLSQYVGNFFIKQPEAPLKQYLERHFTITDNYSLIVAWGKASAAFADYGSLLIKKHPVAYARGYMALNIKNYFLPPLSNLDVYNLGQSDVWTIAQDWFDWKTPDVTSPFYNIQKYILYIFPLLFLFVNLYLFGGLVFLIYRKKVLKNNPDLSRLFILTISFMVINFGFTLFAAINILRYQVVPMAICLITMLLLTELLDSEEVRVRPAYNKQGENRIIHGLLIKSDKS